MCPIQPAISASVCIIRIITSLVTGAAVDDSFIVNSFFSFITSHVYLCWVATKAIYTQPEKLTVVLKKRRGFICIALTSGNSIFPCLGFGEKDLSDMLSDTQSQKHVSKSSNTLFRLQILLKNVTSFSLPIATHLLPKRKKINVIVGAPINFPLVQHPDEELIDKYNTLYCNQLEKIYNKHTIGKSKYGYGNVAIIII